MVNHLTTRAAALKLATTYTKLFNLVRFNHILPPERDGAGNYCWTQDDLERARQALANRRRSRAAAPVMSTSEG